MILELAGFILRSEYRKKVFLKLDKPIMPSKIAKELEIRLTHITRELRFLKERGLAECLNPKEKTGRLYQLTKKGELLKKKMIFKKIL
nr:ArsR family transcriptional regulator [Candidatus Woesearchaeota archaeon]